MDRYSAYEAIAEARQQAELEAEQARIQAEQEAEALAREKERQKMLQSILGTGGGRRKQSALEKTVNSAANTIGRELGNQFVRGLFGTRKK